MMKHKKIATKTELKAEQDKVKNIQTYVSSLIVGQNYFGNNGTQNYFVFQLLIKYF